MRAQAPFQPEDLAELDERLLARAEAVVAMETIADGDTRPGIIGMRHDVDNVIEPAVAMAEWEAERGYRSTYFILHSAPYWSDRDATLDALDRIKECGHEIGFHTNAIATAIQTGRDPLQIIERGVADLRAHGFDAHGVVAHGDPLCYEHDFVNDETFTESARPTYGAPDRVVGGVRLEPVSRWHFGFDYDPNWLSRGRYLSDSGGRWSTSFDDVAEYLDEIKQLHVLIHADWWAEAFAGARV